MAKARVFELAKELGLANEDLLEKMTSMGITGMTHMSALEDEQINQIKEEIGTPKTPEYVEKRLGSTIIRRRKKAPKPEPEIVVEPEASEEEAPAAEGPVASEVIAEPSIPAEMTQEAPAEVEPEPVIPAEAAAPPETVESVETTEAAEAPGIPEQPEAEQPETVAGEIATVSEPIAEAPVEETAAPKEPEKEAIPDKKTLKKAREKTEKKAAKEGKKGAAKKARKKEEPARIIKMPEPERRVEEEPEPEQVRRPKVVPIREETETQPAAEEGGRKGKKKRSRRGAKAAELEDELAQKRFPKRREILERKDLYDEGRIRSFKSKKGGKAPRKSHKTEVTTPKAIKRRIRLAGDTIIVGELAKKMGIKAGELVKQLFTMGVMANLNQVLDFDTTTLVASEFGYEVERTIPQETEILAPEEVKTENLVERPPVITVMGHVDHGKTTLLDAIRESNVVAGESGGITQHIGAYHVKVGDGSMTFLDTPGHEAFTAMRARGAKVTDIVILLAAADDGVMQQTKEAIDHAKAAGVPIIVAVNKIDKANADQDRVKRELSDYGVVPEEWGGDTVVVPISAKQKKGIDELLEYVLLQAEMLELKADPSINARGTVIEARLDKGRGAVATVLVQSGTLKVGDSFLCGHHAGRVRALNDDRGRPVEEAGPSIPVEVQGFTGVPMAGDEFIVLADEKTVKQIAERRQHEQRVASLSQGGAMTLEKLQQQIQEGEANQLNIVLKADVQGSVEALSEALQKLSTSGVSLNPVHASTGAISENDVMLAAASDAIIVGFNVRPTAKVRQLAKNEQVEIRLYEVIYDVINDIKEAMAGRLAPTYEERVLGQAEVRELFRVSKVGTIAGCVVSEGKISRSERARVIREGIVVADGELQSLKRFKDDVKEVAQGFECGINIANFNDVKVGDIIESYTLEEIKATLD